MAEVEKVDSHVSPSLSNSQSILDSVFCLDKPSKSVQAFTLKLREQISKWTSSGSSGIEQISCTVQSLPELLNTAVFQVVGLVHYCKCLNELASLEKTSSDSLAQGLLPLMYQGVLANVENLSSRSVPTRIPESQLIFKALCENYKPRSGEVALTSLPSWFTPVAGQLQIINLSNNLPGAVEYLRRLTSDLTAKMLLAEISKGSSGKNTTGLSFKIRHDEETLESINAMKMADEALERAAAYLKELSTLNPNRVPECLKEIKFAASLNTEALDSMLDFYSKLGQCIKAILSDYTSSKDQVAELVLPIFTSTESKKYHLCKYQIQLNDTHSTEQKEKLLLTLFPAYLTLNHALRDVAAIFVNHAADRGLKREMLQRISDCVQNSFGLANPACRSSIEQLSKLDSKEIRSYLKHILLLPTISSEDSKLGEYFYPIASPHHVFFLRDLINDCLMRSSEDELRQLATDLNGTTLYPLIQRCIKLSSLVRECRYEQLATELDEIIKSATNEQSAAAFTLLTDLLIIDCITSQPRNARNLKSLMKNSALVTDLSAKMKANTSYPELGQIAENARANIESNLGFTLADYWGQTKTKQLICSAIERRLTFLRNPDTWRGKADRKTVFGDGILLYGDPGVGKTYFVECLKNHFRLPLIALSIERMREGKHAKGRQIENRQFSADEYQEEMSAYVKQQVEQANQLMRKSGASAAIIFIDEMEAEFRKRDFMRSSRAELAETNIMLRIFEQAITENPNIIFIGATNHINMVDEAAYRPGRFGNAIEIKRTEKVDVEEILNNIFSQLDISYGEIRKTSNFEQLSNLCVEMTPLAIQQAIIGGYLSQATSMEINDYSSLVKIAIDEVILKKAQIYSPTRNAALASDLNSNI